MREYNVVLCVSAVVWLFGPRTAKAQDLAITNARIIVGSGQVIDSDMNPIPGLYAAGNCTAAVVGLSYPGPGVTLGPAMTFAYLAMQHAAETKRSSQSPASS